MSSSSSSDNAANKLCGLLWEQLTLLCSTVLWFIPGMFFLKSQATDFVTVFAIINCAFYGMKVIPETCHGSRASRLFTAMLISYLSIWAYLACHYLVTAPWPIAIAELTSTLGGLFAFSFVALAFSGLVVVPLVYVNLGILLYVNDIDGDWITV
jgi:hypothetical protein